MNYELANELLLVGVAEQLARTVLPDLADAPGVAAAFAVQTYRRGASLEEAGTATRQFVGSWSRHPSAWDDRPVALAS